MLLLVLGIVICKENLFANVLQIVKKFIVQEMWL